MSDVACQPLVLLLLKYIYFIVVYLTTCQTLRVTFQSDS